MKFSIHYQAAGLLLLLMASQAGVLRAQINGYVFNGATGQPIRATISLLAPDLTLLEEEKSNRSGRFQIDFAVTHGLQLLGHAEGFHSSGPIHLDSLPASELILIELLPLTTETGSSVPSDVTDWSEPLILTGRVLDQTTGDPIGDVEVLLDSVHVSTTSGKGAFRTEVTRSGVYRLDFIRLGYSTVSESIVFEDPTFGVFLTVSMGVEAIQLDPIEVSVVPPKTIFHLQDIQHRIQLGHGQFVLNEDLEMRGHPSFGQVLRSMPGLNFINGIPVFRKARSLGNGWCPPTIYWDGMKMQGLENVMRIPTHEVALVEAYQGAATVPAEFSGSDARCGVIAVWTDRGMGLPLRRILRRNRQ